MKVYYKQINTYKVPDELENKTIGEIRQFIQDNNLMPKDIKKWHWLTDEELNKESIY